MTWLAHLPFALFVLSLAGFGWGRLNTILTYFQQEEYDSSRFLGAVLRVRLFDVLATLGLLALFITHAFVSLGVFVWLIGAALLALLALRERGYTYKKKLVETERLKRIRWLARGFFGALCSSIRGLRCPASGTAVGDAGQSPVARYAREDQSGFCRSSGREIGPVQAGDDWYYRLLRQDHDQTYPG